MRKLVAFFLVIVLFGVILLAGCRPAPIPNNNPTPTPGPTPVPGQHIVHYDGDPYKGMGVGPSTECLVYFNTAKLKSYVGCELRGVQIYYAEDGNSLSTVPYQVKVYNGVGGSATSPGTLIYHSDHPFTEDAWNEVTLDAPIPITNDLEIWAGFNADWQSVYACWPIAHDNLPPVPNTSYIKNTVVPTWGAINVNLNIRLVLWKD